MSPKRMSVSLVLPAVVAGLLLSAAPAAQATSAPTNDNFTQATPLYLTNTWVSGVNDGATTQVGEPTMLGHTPFASVWYTFTPTASGHVIFRTKGSTFDTMLAAYTGSALNGLTQVAANDDASFEGVFTNQSRIDFDAKAGTTYRISVGGYSANTGTYMLSWMTNDSFGAPITLGGLSNGQSFVLSADNDGATLEPNEPQIGNTPGTASEWFSYTPVVNGLATFDTQWSNFSPLIGVYTGSSLTTLKQVKVGSSSVAFSVTAGQTYRIAVQGATGGNLPTTGHFGLQWSQSDQALVSIANSTTTEGNSGTHAMPFTVKLSAASATPVSVTYTTAGVTAKAGSDYVANIGTLTFAPGQTSRTLSVIVTGDTTKESDETFQLKLTGVSTGNAGLGTATATGTIKNDD